MASPTPFNTRLGIRDVNSEPMLYMTVLEVLMASNTRGFAGMRISWPYGLMYHIRLIREGKSSSCSFEKLIAGRLSAGKLPGKLASSILS